MTNLCEKTRESIEWRLTLSVLLGDLDEAVTEVWLQAIRSLDDQDLAVLIRQAAVLPERRASALTLRFLMERHFPFREMIMYQTDETFKRRMGLADRFD